MKIISITSGKGGVGKTVGTLQLASSLARSGKRVLILDGDMGLANVDVLLGIHARYTVEDFMNGEVSFGDLLIPCEDNLWLLPSGSGIARLSDHSYVQKLRLQEHISALSKSFDIMLIDTGAGVGDVVMHLNQLACQNIVVTTPEPHALTDAYGMLKVMKERSMETRKRLVINLCAHEALAQSIFNRIRRTCEQFLSMPIELLGWIPTDPQLKQSVARRGLGAPSLHQQIAAQAWRKIAHELSRDLEVKAQESLDGFLWMEARVREVV